MHTRLATIGMTKVPMMLEAEALQAATRDVTLRDGREGVGSWTAGCKGTVPAGADLSVHSQAYVNKVAHQLNDVRSFNLKPRQRDLTPVLRRPVEPAGGRADIILKRPAPAR
jgi:hypothetical protein